MTQDFQKMFLDRTKALEQLVSLNEIYKFAQGAIDALIIICGKLANNEEFQEIVKKDEDFQKMIVFLGKIQFLQNKKMNVEDKELEDIFKEET